MKKLYKILAIELAMIGVLCMFYDYEIFSISCLIMYAVCLYKSEKE